MPNRGSPAGSAAEGSPGSTEGNPTIAGHAHLPCSAAATPGRDVSGHLYYKLAHSAKFKVFKSDFIMFSSLGNNSVGLIPARLQIRRLQAAKSKEAMAAEGLASALIEQGPPDSQGPFSND